MVLFRSLVYLSFMVLSGIFYSLLIVLIGWALPFKQRSEIANSWGRANANMLKVICGLGYRVEGWEKLPAEHCSIMGNHQSAWETMSLRGILPAQQSWILKQELMKVPFFGWALRLMEPIAIDRSAGRAAVKQVIAQGKERLAKGNWVIVFPEGTRVAYGERKKHGVGGPLLAEKAGVPVLPIVHDAGRFWVRRGIKKLPGEISVRIGKPISTEGKSSSQIRQEVETWMDENLSELERMSKSSAV